MKKKTMLGFLSIFLMIFSYAFSVELRSGISLGKLFFESIGFDNR
ncbi:hypothetical protein [Tepidibacter sp. Z1-5]